jgi:hypothetical protein
MNSAGAVSSPDFGAVWPPLAVSARNHRPLLTRGRPSVMFRSILGTMAGSHDDLTIILKALEGGPVTVDDIVRRFK